MRGGCVSYSLPLRLLLLDRHLLPRHRLNRSLGELRESRKPTSVFRLMLNFMADFLNTGPGCAGCDCLAGPQTSTALFSAVFPGHPRAHVTSSTSSLSTGKCHLCCVRPPSQQIVIASCRAICVGGHPRSSEALASGLLMTFPNLPRRLADRVEQHSQLQSHRTGPLAAPGLHDSSVHVCSSAPWFL